MTKEQGGVKHFLNEHLPDAFGLAKGEVIDSEDHRTGQLDLFIYDKISCSPLSSLSENVLVPCESLYVVIEVKSILSEKELETCYSAAKKVRRLRLFKRGFISNRKGGVAATDKGSRCLYIIFAYKSNLGEKAWMEKEFKRISDAASRTGASVDMVDLVVVLDRGLINPSHGVAKEIGDEPMGIFMEFYLHIINFLGREYERRPPIDWQEYGAGSMRKWIRLRLDPV